MKATSIPWEIEGMLEAIQSPSLRREAREMAQTYAEAFREEGKLEGYHEGKLEAKHQTLLMQLRHKFGRKVTPAFVRSIKRTTDLIRLDTWLVNLLDAQTLDEVGIPRTK
jgi:hypothetical protein